MNISLIRSQSEELAEKVIERLSAEPLSKERKNLLQPLIDYISEKTESAKKSNLIFVCTHNSRRSQMAQFWAHYLADYFELPVASYSGGTEMTACAPQAIAAIDRLGFVVGLDSSCPVNPHYFIKSYMSNSEIILYSKLFTRITETHSPFATLMCCSQAEETCPFVPGSELRVSLNYEDPKHADGSPQEDRAYDQTLMLIGSELHHVFSEVKKRLK